jgi:amidophosphoribosyltransferase
MCGILGIVARSPVNQLLYDGLLLLQHRGQDAAGIVTASGKTFHMHKGSGMVRDVFRTRHMRSLPGNYGIAHCRYPTAGSAFNSAEAQPLYVNSPFGIVLGHNGNLTNTDVLKQEMFQQDLRHINTNSDSEVLLNVLAHELESASVHNKLDPQTIFRAVAALHKRVRGAYAVIAMIAGHGVLAFRDPYGIRPAVIGYSDTPNGREYIIASESVAVDALGFRVLRDIAPGEAVYIEQSGEFHSQQCAEKPSLNPCIFEYVYLARPDSLIDGASVYEARLHMGEKLVEKIRRQYAHLQIDVVIRSGLEPSVGAAARDGPRRSVPRGVRQEPLHRPHVHHAGTVAAQALGAPEAERDRDGVPRQERAAGRRLDRARHDEPRDRADGARLGRAQGVLRVVAPPVRFPNVYGIDMPTRSELIAAHRSEEEVAREIGADALIYQDLDALRDAVRRPEPEAEDLRDFVLRRPLHHRRHHQRLPAGDRDPARRGARRGRRRAAQLDLDLVTVQ